MVRYGHISTAITSIMPCTRINPKIPLARQRMAPKTTPVKLEASQESGRGKPPPP